MQKQDNIYSGVLSSPEQDFSAVRDGRRSPFQWLDIDLSTARSIAAGTALMVDGVAADAFLSDKSTAQGIVTMHIQDTTLGGASAPLYVEPGFIASVPFTKFLIENTAQAGKRFRMIYGVGLDFKPGASTSVNVSGGSIGVTSTVTARNNTENVTNGSAMGTGSANILNANTSRLGCVIQNQGATNLYVAWGYSAGPSPTCLKIAPGQTWESGPNVPTASLFMCSDAAGGVYHVRESY